MVRIHKRGGAVAVIRVRVPRRAIVIHVQAAVRMMVVICVLAMHQQMFNISRPLCKVCRAKRRY